MDNPNITNRGNSLRKDIRRIGFSVLAAASFAAGLSGCEKEASVEPVAIEVDTGLDIEPKGGALSEEEINKISIMEGKLDSATAGYHRGIAAEGYMDTAERDSWVSDDEFYKFGCFASPNKDNPACFACVSEIAEICHNDAREIIKYVDGQRPVLASYIDVMPPWLKPKGFENLQFTEIVRRINNLSEKDYYNFRDEVNRGYDIATVLQKDVEGNAENIGLYSKNQHKRFSNNNIEPVKCYTNEDAIMAVLNWHNDKTGEDWSVIFKIIYDENGNIIGGGAQPIKMVEEGKSFWRVPKVSFKTVRQEDGKYKATTVVEDDDPVVPVRKWGKDGTDANAGIGQVENREERVNPQTVVTKEENEATNEGNEGTPEVQPGAPSETDSEQEQQGDNGGFSEFISDGSNTDEGRLDGGEDQSDGGIAGVESGDNSLSAVEDSGDNTQKQVHDGGDTAGGNNNTDAAEVSAAESGDC